VVVVAEEEVTIDLVTMIVIVPVTMIIVVLVITKIGIAVPVMIESVPATMLAQCTEVVPRHAISTALVLDKLITR
jgi:hypothetical protein